MPRASTNAPKERIDLRAAAQITNYSPDYLRLLIWRDSDPPPFTKYRGRWLADPDELREWVERRDARLSGTA